MNDKRVEEYVKSVSRKITDKKISKDMEIELYDHLYQSIAEMMEYGTDEDKAIELTILEMGNPKDIYEPLNKMYSPWLQLINALLSLFVIYLTIVLVINLVNIIPFFKNAILPKNYQIPESTDYGEILQEVDYNTEIIIGNAVYTFKKGILYGELNNNSLNEFIIYIEFKPLNPFKIELNTYQINDSYNKIGEPLVYINEIKSYVNTLSETLPDSNIMIAQFGVNEIPEVIYFSFDNGLIERRVHEIRSTKK